MAVHAPVRIDETLSPGLAFMTVHFPDEVDVLEQEGVANLAELVAFVRAEGIECELEETGTLDAATEPYQVDELRADAELANRHGNPVRFLERDEIQADAQKYGELANDLLREALRESAPDEMATAAWE